MKYKECYQQWKCASDEMKEHTRNLFFNLCNRPTGTFQVWYDPLRCSLVHKHASKRHRFYVGFNGMQYKITVDQCMIMTIEASWQTEFLPPQLYDILTHGTYEHIADDRMQRETGRNNELFAN